MNGVAVESERMFDTVSESEPWPLELIVMFGPHDEQCDPNGGC